jgi:[methyl-Co(III) methanol-specific corrinoid protein]:coenzyme M methyltransferase
MSRQLFLDAVNCYKTSRPAIGSGTSIVTKELMELADAYFPTAHLDGEIMAKLAMAGHTILGYDVVMPLFSVWHESAAIGCDVKWGDIDHMPDSRGKLWSNSKEIDISKDFLNHNAVQTPLKALSILKKELGSVCAVCGKVFGPWTLGYHVFGTEDWLIKAMLEPDDIKESIEKLKQVTIYFAKAQIEAGADCLLLGDHATRDLCGPDMYREFLLPVHKELAETIQCPLILHICGDTKDRIEYIRQSGIECFHWDTKSGKPQEIKSLAGDKLSLMGGISNIQTLLNGTKEDVISQAVSAAKAGLNIIGPECAVPLGVKVENLKAIAEVKKLLMKNE